ncbi:MAG: phosphate signaling complex protein PhoU [Kofleriaceae bacterium]
MPKTHTDRAYESELRELKDRLLRMAGLVEQMIEHATTALADADLELARHTIGTDAQVNTLEIETDELCLLILAKRQPLASDLRMITLAMKMVTDLERIGDLAVNICERVIVLASPPSPSVLHRLQRMAEIGRAMIRDAIDSFVVLDAGKARTVFARDQEVDNLYRELTLELQREMVRERAFVDRGVHLQACCKFFERVADHGTNLAELVVFQIEGRDLRHSRDRFRPAQTPAQGQPAIPAPTPAAEG